MQSAVASLFAAPPAAPPGDAVSDRILDAALALSAASGVHNLTMDEVARRAGVGRMTVYRRFGDKATLVAALGAREVQRCISELDAAAPADAPIVDQIAEGFVTSLRLAREHPLLNRLARFEPESVLDAANSGGFVLARAFAAQRLRAAQRAGVLGAIDADAAAELLVRLCVSFVLIQDTVLPMHDEEQLRAVARGLIAPVLG